MSNVSPLVSVIIPVYNGEAYLSACIQSVVNQTYSHFEMIIVNDGSLDGSFAIMERHKCLDRRIVLINKSNEGPSSAREAGVNIAKGKYIQFLDSDDELLSDALEQLVNRAEVANADIVVAPFFFCSSLDTKMSTPLSFEELTGVGYLREILYGRTYWSLWSHFLKRSLFCTQPIEAVPNVSFGEDAIMMVQLALCAEKVVSIDVAILNYYIRPSSLSHPQNFNDRKYKEFETYTAWIINYVNRMGLEKEMAKEIALFDIRNTFMSICWKRDCGLEGKMKKVVSELKRYPELKKELPNRDRKIAFAYKMSCSIGFLYLSYCRKRGEI